MKVEWRRWIFVFLIGAGIGIAPTRADQPQNDQAPSHQSQTNQFQTDLKSYGDALVSAQRSGRAEVLTILGLLLAGGASVYVLLKKQLSDRILLIVEERQARNMIRVGLRSWDLAIVETLAAEARLAALQSAIAHTRHAVELLQGLKIDTVVRGDLLALAATNLGYFLATLAMEIKALHSEKDVSPFLQEAAGIVDSVSAEVDSLVRKRRTLDCNWWEVMESRLYVLFRTTSQPDIDQFTCEIKKITEDMMIPLQARKEIGAIWAPMLAEKG